MANLRDLKKDIKYLVSELLVQAFFKQAETDARGEEIINEIMVETVQMHNEFIARANHPDGKYNPEIVKNYYKKLREDVMKKSADLFEKMAAI